MKWNESSVHVSMREFLRARGWRLIAGEFPGGSDHELYPLNVVDPAVARDGSPDPRRHSKGELIPDLVALRERSLLVVEAKPVYSEQDRIKLETLLVERRDHFVLALERFAAERGFPQLLPVASLTFHAALAFPAAVKAPAPAADMSYLRVIDMERAFFEGRLGTSA